MTAEVWRPVIGFDDAYEVSNLGRVASLPKRTRPGRRILRPATDWAGYLYLNLYRNGRGHHRKVHLLVAEAFHGARPAGMEARHIDGDRTNNAASNLTWGTHSENELDKVAHGSHHNASKTHCKASHPLSGSSLYLNPASGARQCRICQGAARAKYQKGKSRV